ncbi:hypothetical protein GUJ93_ZPchr0025g2896 [Zizania palustris]|uniref:Uncharacterized protein n=1 Tax=Zizania palustris TaxID=103762 RepID=A0A8J5R3W1_ZIZPA|nr:hypothetical protein GUJ93_ZPchr0025g2896 [Zizania palustris]
MSHRSPSRELGSYSRNGDDFRDGGGTRPREKRSEDVTVIWIGGGTRPERRRSETESAAVARYNASENEDIDEGEDIDAGADGEDTRVIDVDCDDEEVPCLAAGKINPLLAEITMIGGEKGKNDGGTKQWWLISMSYVSFQTA